MDDEPLQQRFHETVSEWDGIRVEATRYGERTYLLERRQVGHLHGGGEAHFPFPRRVRDELIASGEAQVHPVSPDSGWVEVTVEQESDLERALELARRSYRRAVEANRKKQNG